MPIVGNPIVVGAGGGGDVVYGKTADNTLGVEVKSDSDGNLYRIFYFNGFTKGSGDASFPFPPAVCYTASLFYCPAYNGPSASASQIGWIGFYNGNIRSWNVDLSSTIGGTFWGTLYLKNNALDPDKNNTDANKQNEPYSPPPT